MITIKENRVDIQVEKVGNFYREKDVLIEHNGKYKIFSLRSEVLGGGVDIIEALSEGQRRGKPERCEGLLAQAIARTFNFFIRKDMEVFFILPDKKTYQLV